MNFNKMQFNKWNLVLDGKLFFLEDTIIDNMSSKSSTLSENNIDINEAPVKEIVDQAVSSIQNNIDDGIEIVEPPTEEEIAAEAADNEAEAEETEAEEIVEENKLNVDETIIEKVIELVKEKISSIEITFNTMTIIIKHIMEIIERTSVKGTQQKYLALVVLRVIVDESTILEDLKTKLIELIDSGLIEETIEIIVQASLGRVDINRSVKTVKNCFKICCK